VHGRAAAGSRAGAHGSVAPGRGP